MPTPLRTFAEIAARHGSVDPKDVESVRRWYTEELPNLPRAELEQILEELLASQGSGPDAATPGGYPNHASLPKLHESREVVPPFLAVGLMRRLAALLRPRGDR